MCGRAQPGTALQCGRARMRIDAAQQCRRAPENVSERISASGHPLIISCTTLAASAHQLTMAASAHHGSIVHYGSISASAAPCWQHQRVSASGHPLISISSSGHPLITTSAHQLISSRLLDMKSDVLESFELRYRAKELLYCWLESSAANNASA